MKTCIYQSKIYMSRLACVLLYLLLLLTSSVYAQTDPAQYGTPFDGVPDPRDVNMYQVHTRPFSANGDLQGVIARLDEIKALGTNVIYLMPHYPVGPSNSPYAVQNYTTVGTEYGTLNDLRELVDGAHERGMAIILDFVANHTSWDHKWITDHPAWYHHEGGVIVDPGMGWTDVAQLEHTNANLRTALIQAMRYWIFAANVDGYRFDYADGPPLDFWTQVVTNLRGITEHDLILFAEGNEATNFKAGFDMNFGFGWYTAIKGISVSDKSVATLQTQNTNEYKNAQGSQQVVRYTGNHDVGGHETPLGVFKNHSGVVVNFLVSAYMKGVPLLTSGQEVDFNKVNPWPWDEVKINWTLNPTAKNDFTKILQFRTASTAIRRGTLTNNSNVNVCAFKKTSGTEKVVVIANLRNSTSSYTIPAGLAGTYIDAFSGASVTLTSGATQSLTAFKYMVLTNTTPPPAGNAIAIKNRWKNTYLYDAGANVGYGATIANDNYKWEKVATDDGFFKLKNIGTGQYMHIENLTGAVQCTAITSDWTSAQWSQETVTGSWVRLRNRWKTNNMIHVEGQTGSAEYSGALNAWYSAQWQLEATTSSGASARMIANASEVKTEEKDEALVEIYPNPSRDKHFRVTIPRQSENEMALIAIQDINGRTVFKTEMQNSGDIQHALTPGLYFVRVRTREINTVKKIVIE